MVPIATATVADPNRKRKRRIFIKAL